ncbi:phage head closure protein [Rhizobium halophilum]|uniref:phage head closure protein n=1 Tax=Rhizobium halophilum TaxID=2846852 RepID=UPI001EFD17F5|nr:phage head closure protein [Rhizobium halophilum]MCF6370472.1 phage head closure protein [Rhizobium halophilum]
MADIFDPGQMTARLVLEAPVEMPDGQGGVTVTWEEVRSLWARMEPVRVSERQEAGAESVTISHRIWIWFREDVVAGQRFRKDARLFAVTLVRDPDETRRFLVCHCEEASA